jgi:hypothetical protein
VRGIATGLLRDSDWAPLDGEICRVTTLTPMGWTKGVPYASVKLESPVLAEPTAGFVTHKLDFEHLSEAFSRREHPAGRPAGVTATNASISAALLYLR